MKRSWSRLVRMSAVREIKMLREGIHHAHLFKQSLRRVVRADNLRHLFLFCRISFK
jgi:hypothetical protein